MRKAPFAVPFAPPTFWRAVTDAVLTTDFKQRRCLTVFMVTAMVTVTSLGLMAFGATHGLFGARPVLLLASLCAINSTGFYIAIRSGWNQRCAEPSLAFAQAMVALTLIALAYAIAGPIRGTVIVMLALVMVFGMFNMRAANVRVACAYSVAIMGVVMAVQHVRNPDQFGTTIEAIHFGVVVTVMAALALLSEQLMNMRSALKRQKRELEDALTQIGELATRDELTGLANRRRMVALLAEHALRRARGGPDFYVAMVDLDHFKQVNDRYGHAVGDQALQAFAAQARSTLRSTDIVGRWGGEEVVLLLPETPPGEPTIGVERLRADLAQAPVSTSEPALRVGFSAGFTRYQNGEALDDTIDRADRALYAAKAAGRNRTVLV